MLLKKIAFAPSQTKGRHTLDKVLTASHFCPRLTLHAACAATFCAHGGHGGHMGGAGPLSSTSRRFGSSVTRKKAKQSKIGSTKASRSRTASGTENEAKKKTEPVMMTKNPLDANNAVGEEELEEEEKSSLDMAAQEILEELKDDGDAEGEEFLDKDAKKRTTKKSEEEEEEEELEGNFDDTRGDIALEDELLNKKQPQAAKEKDANADSEVDNMHTDDVHSKHLTDCFPEYAAEYDDSNEVDVSDILTDNASVVKWNCPACGEQWKCAVFVRCILKTSCPTCNTKKHPSLADVRPDLVRLWDSASNSPFETPDRVPADSRLPVSWKCAQCGNSYRAKVKDRVLEKNKCPSCELMNLKSANDLAQEESALLQEWHPLKNGDLSLDQVQPTDQKTQIWWLCSVCGHDWQATLATRLSRRKKAGKSCPVCQRKLAGQ